MRVWTPWLLALAFLTAAFLVSQPTPPSFAPQRACLAATPLEDKQSNPKRLLTREEKIADGAAFEKAVDLSQKLSDAVLLILAGSIVVLTGTYYRQPLILWKRSVYLLFPVGWYLLWQSVNAAITVRGVYIDYLFKTLVNEGTRMNRICVLSNYSLQQDQYFRWGVLVFALWLSIYLILWISFPSEFKEIK